MITFIEKRRTTPLYRVLSAFIAFTFIFTSILPPQAAAQLLSPTVLNLPVPGTMVGITPGFSPVLIKALTLYPDDPLKFDFIMDEGNTQMGADEFEQESSKLIKYFMTALTVPEDEIWVNLSPYEKDRIVPGEFGETEMARDLLAQDYLLKQLTASLMYPEEKIGRDFWKNVYAKAQEQFGTTEIPVSTFNKIWIVPEHSSVYEHEKGAFVVDGHMKVMLEEDYLALDANVGSTKHGLGDVTKDELNSVSDVQSQILREIIVPAIEKEVNEGETFANLRQIYNSVILATWYKQALKESLLGQVYVDQKKTAGVGHNEPGVNQEIYEQYVAAYKKGVFNFIKEDYDPVTQAIIPRKYFSGGIGTKGTEETQGKVLSKKRAASAMPEKSKTVKMVAKKVEKSSSGLSHLAKQEKASRAILEVLIEDAKNRSREAGREYDEFSSEKGLSDGVIEEAEILEEKKIEADKWVENFKRFDVKSNDGTIINPFDKSVNVDISSRLMIYLYNDVGMVRDLVDALKTEIGYDRKVNEISSQIKERLEFLRSQGVRIRSAMEEFTYLQEYDKKIDNLRNKYDLQSIMKKYDIFKKPGSGSGSFHRADVEVFLRMLNNMSFNLYSAEEIQSAATELRKKTDIAAKSSSGVAEAVSFLRSDDRLKKVVGDSVVVRVYSGNEFSKTGNPDDVFVDIVGKWVGQNPEIITNVHDATERLVNYLSENFPEINFKHGHVTAASFPTRRIHLDTKLTSFLHGNDLKEVVGDSVVVKVRSGKDFGVNVNDVFIDVVGKGVGQDRESIMNVREATEKLVRHLELNFLLLKGISDSEVSGTSFPTRRIHLNMNDGTSFRSDGKPAKPSAPVEVKLNIKLGQEEWKVPYKVERSTAENLSSTTAIENMLREVDEYLKEINKFPFQEMLEEYGESNLTMPIVGKILKDHPDSDAAKVFTQVLEFAGSVYAKFIDMLRKGELKSQDGDKLLDIEEGWRNINAVVLGGGINNNVEIRRIFERKILEKFGNSVTILPILSSESQTVSEEAGILGAVLLVNRENRKNKVILGVDRGAKSTKVRGVQFDENGKFEKFVGEMKRFTFDEETSKDPNKYFKEIAAGIKDLDQALKKEGFDVSHFIGEGHPGKKETDGKIAQKSWPNHESYYGVNPAAILGEYLGGHYEVLWMNDAFVQGGALYHLSGVSLPEGTGLVNISPGGGLGAALYRIGPGGVIDIKGSRDLHAQHDPSLGESIVEDIAKTSAPKASSSMSEVQTVLKDIKKIVPFIKQSSRAKKFLQKVERFANADTIEELRASRKDLSVSLKKGKPHRKKLSLWKRFDILVGELIDAKYIEMLSSAQHHDEMKNNHIRNVDKAVNEIKKRFKQHTTLNQLLTEMSNITTYQAMNDQKLKQSLLEVITDISYTKKKEDVSFLIDKLSRLIEFKASEIGARSNLSEVEMYEQFFYNDITKFFTLDEQFVRSVKDLLKAEEPNEVTKLENKIIKSLPQVLKRVDSTIISDYFAEKEAGNIAETWLRRLVNAKRRELKAAKKGGIDMNAAMINMEIQHNEDGVIIPVAQYPVGAFSNIDGFVPVILNIAPTINLPMTLGLADEAEKDTDFGYNFDPMDDRKAKLEELVFEPVQVA